MPRTGTSQISTTYNQRIIAALLLELDKQGTETIRLDDFIERWPAYNTQLNRGRTLKNAQDLKRLTAALDTLEGSHILQSLLVDEDEDEDDEDEHLGRSEAVKYLRFGPEGGAYYERIHRFLNRPDNHGRSLGLLFPKLCRLEIDGFKDLRSRPFKTNTRQITIDAERAVHRTNLAAVMLELAECRALLGKDFEQKPQLQIDIATEPLPSTPLRPRGLFLFHPSTSYPTPQSAPRARLSRTASRAPVTDTLLNQGSFHDLCFPDDDYEMDIDPAAGPSSFVPYTADEQEQEEVDAVALQLQLQDVTTRNAQLMQQNQDLEDEKAQATMALNVLHNEVANLKQIIVGLRFIIHRLSESDAKWRAKFNEVEEDWNDLQLCYEERCDAHELSQVEWQTSQDEILRLKGKLTMMCNAAAAFALAQQQMAGDDI